MRIYLTLLVLLLLAVSVRAAPDVTEVKGKLVYATTQRGDRIPDFSHAGYMGGCVPIPNAPVRIVVPRIDGDNTARIQSAIDYVSSLPPDHGIRGAVLLQKGRYDIAGALHISTSGVVLRGSDSTLVATGLDRRTLIRVIGKNDRVTASPTQIADDYVPINATRLRFRNPIALKPHDQILITRPSTADWIKSLHMDNMGGDRHTYAWRPGSRDLTFDRTITAVHDDTIEFDAPITLALDKSFGGAAIAGYTWPGRISQVGIENVRCVSQPSSGNEKDEDHSWIAITMENAQDCWVRQVTCEHFVGGAVQLYDTTRRITVEDCKSLAPISEIAGYRRHTFFTNGQLNLFNRCYSENGRHDFSVGFCAAGPNVFVQCHANNALDDSGPIDSLAAGVLYDNVRIDGNALSLYDRQYRAQGAGWSAFNSVLWQCTASVINVFSPPGAQNWGFGCWGTFSGNGNFSSSRESIRPVSFYWAQLAERLGDDAAKEADIMMTPSDASSSPTPEVAAQLIAASTQPAPNLSDWIDKAAQRHPIPTDSTGAKTIDDITIPTTQPAPAHHISITHGIITSDGKPLSGKRQPIKWWAGGIRPDDVAHADPMPTRFVPGRVGSGLTDDLDQLTDDMRNNHRIVIEHHEGLWYDTRDADHERVRRMDGDVWPPFYEQPFARSGNDLAWDGLSKYDLTKYNPWYFTRLHQLATRCDQKGLVLLNDHYFQHNIIEAGAHWASFPWRSANNINDTGFPEPPPYVGDKRIFMAEQFYDLTHPTRRKLHEQYIRKCLDNFAGSSNVIHQISAEFTGPLTFMQFWLDTIAAYKRDTGKKPLIGLAAPKDVQDAILSDPQRAALIDVINIEYWWYQSDGTAYAPQGGLNLAPRQHARVLHPKSTSAEQVARAVREYRQKYPEKAVIYSADGADHFGQAAREAGASLAP